MMIKKIMHFFFLSCYKATEIIEKKLHVELSFKEKLRLKIHKLMCRACYLYDKQSTVIDSVLKKRKHKTEEINIEQLKISIKEKISDI